MLWKSDFSSCSPGTWVNSDSSHTFTRKHIQTMQQWQDLNKVPNLQSEKDYCNYNKQLKTLIRSDHLITHFLLWFWKPAATLCQNFSASLFLKGSYYIVHARGCTMNQTLLNVCKMSNAAHCLSKMFNVDVKHFVQLDSVSSVVFSICIKSGS